MIDKKLMQKLKDKGVSSDVILDLMLEEDADPAPAPKDPDPAPKDPDPAPTSKDPEPAPAPGIRGGKVPPVQQPQTDAILAAIEKLTGAVQAANMRNDYHGGEGGDTVDDILGKIIK